MKNKMPLESLERLSCLLLVLVLCFSSIAFGAEPPYLPAVTEEMTDASYWTKDLKDADKRIMTPEEILKLNQLSTEIPATRLVDLKNEPERFDGNARNEALRTSATADAEYYFGWTFLGKDSKASWDEFQELIDNCYDKAAEKEQSVKYAIAVKRALLQVFPSDTPIWDDPSDPDFDYQALSSINVNEPLLLYTKSKDGKFYNAQLSCCSGWVAAEDVAICETKEEWLSAWDIPEENTLTVYGKVYTASSNYQPETSERMLGIGTKLELVERDKLQELISNRSAYHNYAVYLPIRNADGSYAKLPALLPHTAQVCTGYLPLTPENIARLALSTLGEAYGWGGMLNTEDCSGMIRKIYSCFGLDIGRNGNWQWEMPIEKIDLSYLSVEEKEEILDQLPLGTALCFPGHEMLYLGKSDDKYYVVSNISLIVDPDDHAKKNRIRGSVISTLDTLRANGLTWLESINKALMPAYGLEAGKSYEFPDKAWYYDGMSYCLKNGFMSSEENGFEPNKAATRKEAVSALWSIAGKPITEAKLPFTDIDEAAAIANAARWAAAAGIANGTEPGLFSPDAPLTRQQLCVLLYRYLKPEAKAETNTPAYANFADAKLVASYASEAMHWAVSEGIIKGTGANMLSPDALCTRAELAVSLMRVFEAE